MLPLDGDLDRVEYRFNAVGELGTDTVSGDEGDGVFAWGLVGVLRGERGDGE